MLFLLSPLKLIVLFMFYFLPSPSGKVSLKATEGDNKSLLHFALHFYPLSSKSRLRSILPLPPKEEAVMKRFQFFLLCVEVRRLYFSLQSDIACGSYICLAV